MSQSMFKNVEEAKAFLLWAREQGLRVLAVHRDGFELEPDQPKATAAPARPLAHRETERVSGTPYTAEELFGASG